MLAKSKDEWKKHVPGKPIFSQFCAKAKISEGRLKTLYIQNSDDADKNPFSEIYEIFEQFSLSDN